MNFVGVSSLSLPLSDSSGFIPFRYSDVSALSTLREPCMIIRLSRYIIL